MNEPSDTRVELEVVAWTSEGALSVLKQHWPMVDCITVSTVTTPQTETGLVRLSEASTLLRSQADTIARTEEALNNIRELNMSGTDENGHRWANSDLVEQEIVAAFLKDQTP